MQGCKVKNQPVKKADLFGFDIYDLNLFGAFLLIADLRSPATLVPCTLKPVWQSPINRQLFLKNSKNSTFAA
jgi:hypothetical protein